MNTTALATGLLGVALGALAVFNVEVRKRPWIGFGTLAFGAALLIGFVTEGNSSRTEHQAVFIVQVVLISFFLVCVVMDARARSRLRRPGSAHE